MANKAPTNNNSAAKNHVPNMNLPNGNNTTTNQSGKQYPMQKYPLHSAASNPMTNNMPTNSAQMSNSSTAIPPPPSSSSSSSLEHQHNRLNVAHGYPMERNNNQMANQSNAGQNQTHQQINSMLSHSNHLPFPYNLNNFHRNF